MKFAHKSACNKNERKRSLSLYWSFILEKLIWCTKNEVIEISIWYIFSQEHGLSLDSWLSIYKVTISRSQYRHPELWRFFISIKPEVYLVWSLKDNFDNGYKIGYRTIIFSESGIEYQALSIYIMQPKNYLNVFDFIFQAPLLKRSIITFICWSYDEYVLPTSCWELRMLLEFLYYPRVTFIYLIKDLF